MHQNDNEITKSGAVNVPDDPDDVPLLYPGYKGVPSKEPFLSFHQTFIDDLLDTSTEGAIFIGFAFRDSFINNIIDFALSMKRQSFRIHCFNPVSVSNCPSDSRLFEFADKYPEQFYHYQEPFEIKESPLGLNVMHQRRQS